MSDDREQIAHLRAVAHPLRVRMLSLLTAEALSATEIARRLDLTHANASYHLRVLHEAGHLLVESEEKVRGGTAKRYRYRPRPADGALPTPGRATDADALVGWAHATHTELVRRAAATIPGHPGFRGDLEGWFEPESWTEVLDLVTRAMLLLHERARPEGTPGTVHASLTATGFVMGQS